MKAIYIYSVLAAVAFAVLTFVGCPAPVVPVENPPDAAPTGLTVTGATDTTIALSWSGVSSAAHYNVYQCLTVDGAYTPSAAAFPSQTSAIASGLAPVTTYYYKVAAANSGGEGPLSAAVPGTTLSVGVTPDEGRDAFLQDYKEGMLALVDAISDNPLDKAGTKTYTVAGVAGGSVSLKLTKTVTPLSLKMTTSEVFTWNNYQGTFGTTISNSYSITETGVSGTLSFTFSQKPGTCAFSGSNSVSGSLTGTYKITFEGLSWNYDLATGLPK